MSKRKFNDEVPLEANAENETDIEPKKKISNDEIIPNQYENLISTAGPSNEKKPTIMPSPPLPGPTPARIFKLNIYCFREIFDRLPVNDLNSLAKTCKRMQTDVGEYFHQKYTVTARYSHCSGKVLPTENVDANLDGLLQFVKKIKIGNNEAFAYFGSNCKNLVEEIRFSDIHISATDINHIKDILGNVESVHMMWSTFVDDFYGDFLKFIPNLKKLSVDKSIGDNNNQWAYRKYPTLEHLEWLGETSKYRILKPFLKRNTSI